MIKYMQLNATYAKIYTLDELWKTLLRGGKPTEIYRKNNKIKLNHEIKDQFALNIHYKKIHKENILEQIENAYTVQFLESSIRTNLDSTAQWWI